MLCQLHCRSLVGAVCADIGAPGRPDHSATAATRAPNPPVASVQAPLDPGYAALIATCKTPPPARGGGGPGGARGGGRGVQPQGVRDYAVTEIPGVIKAGGKWTFVCSRLVTTATASSHR